MESTFFVELIDEEFLTVLYSHAFLAVATQTKDGHQYHDLAEIALTDGSFESDIREICIATTGKSGKGRRKAIRLEQKIKPHSMHSMVLEGARQTILEPSYIEAAARIVLQDFSPSYDASKIFFRTQRSSNGIVVSTNLNGILNEQGHSINAAGVLAHVMDLDRELYLSSSHNSELATSLLSAKLGELKINQVISKSKNSSVTKDHFNEFVFDDAKALREAVNSNHIDLDDLLKLLRRSRQFKKWIVNLPPDADLIKSYYKEVTAKTVIDKLPGKTSRWAIFTGLGVGADISLTGGIGTAIGIGLGALDTFYLDKLFKGWKPNQFIEEDIKNMIAKNKNP